MDRIKQRVYRIITEPDEHDTLGQIIHVSVLILIAVNVVVGLLETVSSLHAAYQRFFYWFEFVSVMIFTVEYVLRLWSCTSQEVFRHPIRGRWKMATQPMAVIDFLAIAPFYLQTLIVGADLRFIRILRLFRLFRLFRMGRLVRALLLVGRVFQRKKEELYTACIVLIVVVVFSASLMYLVEGKTPDTKFTSIPASMWWAMITVTTIGYGDMHPVTPLGQFVGSFIAFLGVCVFALPVAILGAGFIEALDTKSHNKPVDADKTPPNDVSLDGIPASPQDEFAPASLSQTSSTQAPNFSLAPSLDTSVIVRATVPISTSRPVHIPSSVLQPPAHVEIDAALLDAIAERVALKLQDSVAYPAADQIADQIADRVVDQIVQRVLVKLQHKDP